MYSAIPETEVAWLAGIFDGEGGARIYRRANGHFWVQVCAVCNTDPLIVARVVQALDGLGISYSFRRNNGNDKRRAYYSPCSDVRVTNRVAIIKYLAAVIPYTTGSKKCDAERVVAFFRLPAHRPSRGKQREPEVIDAQRELYKSQSFRPKPKSIGPVN